MPIADILYSRIGAALADQFDLTRPPRLREERFERTVKAQERTPALSGNRLNPVAVVDPCRFARTEINGRGPIGIRHGGGRLGKRIIRRLGCRDIGSTNTPSSLVHLLFCLLHQS